MSVERPEEVPVVTFREMKSFHESVSRAADRPAVDEVEQARVMGFYARVMRELEAATADSDPDVLVTVTDQEASLFQTRVAEQAADYEKLESGGLEVKFGNWLEDPFGWISSVRDYTIITRKKRHALTRPSSTAPVTLPGHCRIALMADWATGLYGAPVSAETIAQQEPWDLLMHLGDVYYSGTPKETSDRFTRFWPTDSGTLNRAVNGNHEMYSGGYGYFDDILPEFDQEASYFALCNDDWLLIGLDAAYEDHAVDNKQADWVQKVIADHKHDRKVLLFSHHQPFSRLAGQGRKIVDPMRRIFDEKLVTAWYWGHEHDCLIYERDEEYGFHGRCLGNGGIPTYRRKIVREAETEQKVGEIMWKRLDGDDHSPRSLVLDGPNRWIPKRQEKFVPHGYVSLELNGPALIERFHLPDGTEIYAGELG